MDIADADRLLDPDPLPLETGVQRLASGVLLVAARTDMRDCRGEMVEWWFRFAPDSQQYAWWHPGDHVSSSWHDTSPGTHVGSTHDAEEKLGSDSPVLRIQVAFQDPLLTFSPDALEAARAAGNVSGLVCAHLGIGDDPPRDEAGRPLNGRMVHLARDTPYGCVLRSRFWLGEGTGRDSRFSAM